MKKDGHTHTQFSHHGATDEVATYIERAIQLGFDTYVITEHAPLPLEFVAQAPDNLRDYVQASAMTFAQADQYFARVQALQQQYADRIKVKIGLEVDYLVGFEQQTQAMINRYADVLEEIVLSVHFMPDHLGTLRGIDGVPTMMERDFLAHMSVDEMDARYFDTVLKSVEWAMDGPATTRIGHLTLLRKFARYFDLPDFSQDNRQKITTILKAMRAKGYELDANAAGFFKEFATDMYPDVQTLKLAQSLNIPIVYGSDAHSVDDVGRGYETVMARVFDI